MKGIAGLAQQEKGMNAGGRFARIAHGMQRRTRTANQIATGQTQVAIAGGVDSISMRTRQEPAKANGRFLRLRMGWSASSGGRFSR